VSFISNTLPEKHPVEITSALAHEVRNPLSNINLAVDMLATTVIDEVQKTYIDIILRSASRISALISDFLTICQPNEMQSGRLRLNELLDEVMAIMQDKVILKGITVQKEYTDTDYKIWGNKQQIKIALSNIITNAIEAVPFHKGELRLVVKSIENKCCLEIIDNGIGISKENLANIFKPYFSNKEGGMGLGLSTTVHILQKHHALVDVKSEIGKGTSFILSFEEVQ
jgi:signal transduction histidine kinase